MFDLDKRPSLFLYLAVALVAGAVIALQIGVMRIFAVGSWAHFGSMVVSLAMLGFGLASAFMCVRTHWFDEHWRGVAAVTLLLFGPLMVIVNLVAQQIPFNAIFLISDPMQKWRLFGNFMLYFLPFLAAAVFLGTVFLKAKKIFGRVYFADLAGSGLSGLLFLLCMYLLHPENLIVVPLLLWFVGGVLWFISVADRRGVVWLLSVAVISVLIHFSVPSLTNIPKLAVSDYKGVSYARKFPDSKRIYESNSPFGRLEIYSSSYLHFAPGLSDNAAFNLKSMPSNAYLGLYIDGEGPSGIIQDLPKDQTAYFRYLSMNYPYVIKDNANVFVVQFGGGISTTVALQNNTKSVTVAEGNPAVLNAFYHDQGLRDFTKDILNHPKLSVIDYDGRLYLARTKERYDIIDLSLADSAGLSNPGGFAIVEKFSYTRESMTNYLRALAPGGVLSVTLWNKEEPPKSVIKLYATMAAAAREFDEKNLAQSFFVVSNYLSTATVLYKQGGFTADEITKLRAHTRAMSFDEIYSPGIAFDDSQTNSTLENYRNQIFFNIAAMMAESSEPGQEPEPEPEAIPTTLPSITLGRLAWQHLIKGDWDSIAEQYVFDVRPLTNHRPYFAAYVKPADLPRITDRLELMQDEWGYLLVWATLIIACIAALSLVLFPVIAGWRTIFSHYPGKFGSIIYFACLGAGYIMVEVGLIAHFVLALSNPTVSASVLITGMLVFTGLGSFVSERYLDRARSVMPWVFIAIGVIVIGYGYFLDIPLGWIGTLDYGWRLLFCFLLILPPAFLMGFPMPTGMTSLGRLHKDHLFIWAWGINGSFSVIGAAIVPLIATSFGLNTVLTVAGIAYLIAIPAFFSLLLPLNGVTPGRKPGQPQGETMA